MSNIGFLLFPQKHSAVFLFLGQPHKFCPQNQHLLFSTAGPYNTQKCMAELEQNFFIAAPKQSVSLGSKQYRQGEGTCDRGKDTG